MPVGIMADLHIVAAEETFVTEVAIATIAKLGDIEEAAIIAMATIEEAARIAMAAIGATVACSLEV